MSFPPAVDIVHSSLDFFHKTSDGQLPFIRLFNDGSGKPILNYVLKEEVVKIENIRGKEHLYTLDTSGFQFFRCDTRYTTFETKEDFEREYISEAVEFTKRLTDAIKVVPFELCMCWFTSFLAIALRYLTFMY